MPLLTRRQLLFGLAGGGALIVAGDTAAAIQDAKRPGGLPSGGPRVGTVVAVNGSTLSVHVGGGVLQDMPYLLGVQVAPGDDVALMQIGGTWYVLGPFAGMPASNLVVNGSFEDAAGNPSTTGWDFRVIDNSAGTPSWSVDDVGPFSGGGYVAGLQGAFIDCSTNGLGGSTTEGKLRSSAIPVKTGEQYAGAAMVGGSAPSPISLPVVGSDAILPIIQVDVAIEFYAGAADTTSIGSADYGPIPPLPYQFSLMRTPMAVIPSGVNYIRLTLDFSVNDVSSQVYNAAFDRCIIRKIRNADGTLAL